MNLNHMFASGLRGLRVQTFRLHREKPDRADYDPFSVTPLYTATQEYYPVGNVGPRWHLGYIVLGASSALPVPGLPGVVGLPLVIATILGLGMFQLKHLRRARVLLTAGALSLGWYILAAGVDSSPPFQRTNVILIANLLSIAAYLTITKQSTNKIASLIVGHCAGWTVVPIVVPSSETAGSFGDLWKFGIAVPVTVVLLSGVISYSRGRSWIPAAALCVIAVVSIFLNFRSHGLVCIVAAAAFLSSGMNRSPVRSRRARGIVAQISVFALLVLPVSLLPGWMEAGWFGPAVQEKALSQADDGPALLAGRTEPALSYVLIKARPVFGWGEGQNIPDELVAEGRDVLASVGFRNADATYRGWYRNGDTVTVHSMLAQSWVEGGLVAGVFLVALLIYGSFTAIRYKGPLSLLLYYLASQMIWDTLFSPHTSFTAILWGMAAALFVSASSEKAPNTKLAVASRPGRKARFLR